MSVKMFPFWWLVPPVPVTIFTVYTHVIDGSFSAGASLIGGAQTIDGLVFCAYISAQDPADDYLNIALYINGIDTSTYAGPIDRDKDFLSWGEAITLGNNQDYGFPRDFFLGDGELPHTSYDLKAKETGLYKKTVKVLVIHRQA